MDATSSNESQVQHKKHFYKTVQDLPIYNIHKHFEAFDLSQLSVENIIKSVFFNCEDKRHAQICAQTYICHRIISKAKKLNLTAIFYQDPYEDVETLYEEPTYILVKSRNAGIALKILAHPSKVLLHKCSGIIKRSSKKVRRKKKATKQERWKTNGSVSFDESIVGKFPTLIVPKLSPEEIEYHMKAQFKIFDKEKKKNRNPLKMRKCETIKKTKYVKENKENLPKNAEVRRSSRLIAKKKVSTVEKHFQCNNKCLVSDESCLQEDYQHVETNFQKDNCSFSTKTCFQENFVVREINSHKDGMTILEAQPVDIVETQQLVNQVDDQHVEKHFQVDIYPTITNTNFPEKNNILEFIAPKQDPNLAGSQYLQEIQKAPKNSNMCEIIENDYLDKDEMVDNQIASPDVEKCYEGHTLKDVVETQRDVLEETCKHLKNELGLDKDVVESLQELYRNVQDGKNNYVYCEFIY